MDSFVPDLGDFDNFLSEDPSRDAAVKEERSLQEGEVGLKLKPKYGNFFRSLVMKRKEAIPWWQDMTIWYSKISKLFKL